jgi:hypothetical protein
MSMIPKRLEDIVEDDLNRLIGVAEGKQLEFKENIVGNTDDQIKEFLKDVSAMANAIGGDIVYGVAEALDQNGNTTASAIHGLAGQNSDDVILRLDNLIRDCVKPRLVGYGIQHVPLASGNSCFVVRIQKSWNPPHVVDRRGHWRFYYRDSAGTHPMDVTELRHAMTFSDTLARSLEEFRLTQLSKIAANSVLGERAKLILHLQPLSSAQIDAPIDIGRMTFDPMKVVLMPNMRNEPETRLNFEGLLAYNGRAADVGYLQVFRNGSIEVVDTTIPSQRRLPMRTLEKSLMITTTRCLGLMNDLGITSPVVLHVTLLGVNMHRIEIEEDPQNMNLYFLNRQAEENPIQERDLLLPNIMIVEEELLRYANLTVANTNDDQAYLQLFRQAGMLLRPLFDIIWNAGGFQESPHFDEAGVWRGRVVRW